VTNSVVADADNATAVNDQEDTLVNQSVLGPVDLTLDKSIVSSDSGPFVAGETVVYEIVINNLSTVTATDVVVYDLLPAELTAVSSTISPTNSTSNDAQFCANTTCSLDTVAPGETVTIRLTATLSADVVVPGVVINSAAVRSANPEMYSTNNNDGVTVVVSADDTLAITKSAPSKINPGELLTYQIVVSNSGPSAATSVTISDTLPLELMNLFVTSSQGSCVIVGGLLSCNIDTLHVDKSASVFVTGRVDESATGAIVNRAAATSDADSIGVSDEVQTLTVAVSDLALSKEATPTVVAGELITYTLTAYNYGPSTARGVMITDTLPSGMTFAEAGIVSSGTFSGTTNCGHNAGVVVCGTPILAAGSSWSIMITALADSAIEPGSSIENQAVLGSENLDTDLVNNSDAADTSIISLADLSIRKQGPLTVTAGTEITYTIVVTNGGPSTAHFVDVKENLPVGVTLVDAVMERTGSGQAACGGTVCQMGDMVVGETVTITVVGLVDPAIMGGTMLVNEATLFSNSSDPDEDDQRDTAVTEVVSDATLTLAKVALDEPVAPNGSLLYQITVMNEGLSDAQNVVIQDPLSSDVRFVSASAGCTYIDAVDDGTISSGLVTCAIGTLPANSSSTVLLAVHVKNLPDGTQIVNVAEATTDSGAAVPSATVTSTVRQDFGPTVDLGLEKSTAADTIDAGEQITYTLVVTSSGPGAATNVQLQEFVPAGASITNIQIDNPDVSGEYCSLGGLCYLATVFPDTAVMVTVTLHVESGYLGEMLQNSASIRADQPDSDMSNNFDEVTTPVEKQANLSLVKSDLADPVYSGELLLYQLAVTNHGPSDAQNVVLTDVLSDWTIFMGATSGCTHDGATTEEGMGGTVVCAMNAIGAGETETVLIETRVSDAIAADVTLRNRASVGSSTPDLDLLNNEDEEDTLAKPGSIQPTDLAISKIDLVDPVTAGMPLTYTLVVTNSGPAVAYNVQVEDAISNGMTYQYAGSSQGTCNDSVICSIGTLDVGATATITLVVQVDSSRTTDLFNQATVSASSADINQTNNLDTEITSVKTEASLSISKSARPMPAFAGSMMGYKIVVRNAGPSDARDVVMTENLPDALLDVLLSSSQGDCTLSGVCLLGAIPAGKSATINVNGLIDPTTRGSITNSASVVASNAVGEESGAVVTNVSSLADLHISKVSNPISAIAGGTIVYTITVKNLAGSAAPDVVVTDTLPSHVTFNPLMSGPNIDEIASGVLHYKATQNPLHVGATEQFTVAVTLDPETPESLLLVNSAEVSSAISDTDLSNNQATAENSIGQLADLVIEKDGPSAVIAGSEITYTIAITNYGPSAAQSVQMQDILPTSVRLNSVSITRSGVGSYSCTNAISCILGDMAVNEVATITISGTVDAGIIVGRLITNEAVVFTDTPVRDSTKLTDSATTLIATAVTPEWDASIRAPASVGNWVWLDEDSDGIRGPDEPGVENVLVMLYDNSGNLIDTAITTADGFYEFTYLPPGRYTINFSAPPGMEFTEQRESRDNQYNSDADPATGTTGTITLLSGAHQPNWGAGLVNIRPTSLETKPEFGNAPSEIYLPFLAR